MNSLTNVVSVMPWAINQNVMMPTLLGTLEMGFQDLRIGKFVDGIGLTVSNNTQLHLAYDSKLSNTIKNLNTCNVNILKAKELLFSCPEGQKLWNEVEVGGPFTIRCATSKEAPAGALVWVEKREILLSETNNEMVKPLVFELNNLKRTEMASLIGRYQCNLHVDEYASTIEAIEYGTVEDTYKISESCVNGGFWPSDLNNYQEEFSGKSDKDWTTFKGYLETQEKYGHTDLYRMGWYKKCNPQGLSNWIAGNIDKWRAVLAQSKDKDQL